MLDNDKIYVTIAKLTQLTQSGDIDWQEWNYPDGQTYLRHEEYIVGSFYVCSYNDKYLRIYKFRARHFYEEDSSDWSEFYQLDITDENYKPKWSFPGNRGVKNLYDIVNYKVSGAEEFINGFF